MRSVLAGALVLGLSLACGSGTDPGFREIKSGGGPLEITLTGAMTGRMTAEPMTPTELDAEVGLYGPQPQWNAPRGQWMAIHTATNAGDPDPWQLDVQNAAHDGVAWTGPCGAPRPDGTFVLVFPDGPGAMVSMGVSLDNEGLASFEGTATTSPTDAATITANGTWKLEWCRSGSALTAGAGTVGPGTVEITYATDPASLRSWPAPKRGAF
ncbi:MAG: hypothetical protein H6737_24455 [Alphaproteobacteria bacterium]|nr:hypothetical protein [Alphaproteobacteria bacterium]